MTFLFLPRLARRFRLFKDESGVALTEYALLLAVIALVAITGVTLLGTNLSALFTAMAGSL